MMMNNSPLPPFSLSSRNPFLSGQNGFQSFKTTRLTPKYRMTSKQNTQIPLVWYFSPEEEQIAYRRLSADSKGSIYESLKPLLHCEHVDTTCVQTDKHTRYIIWYNDVGAYEQEPFNLVATVILKSIQMNWGAHELCGWYVVTKEKLNPAWWDPEKVTEQMWEEHRDAGWEYADMDDACPKQWVKSMNTAIKKSMVERAEFFKQLSANKDLMPQH